jgi:hypothetical protein
MNEPKEKEEAVEEKQSESEKEEVAEEPQTVDYISYDVDLDN